MRSMADLVVVSASVHEESEELRELCEVQ